MHAWTLLNVCSFYQQRIFICNFADASSFNDLHFKKEQFLI